VSPFALSSSLIRDHAPVLSPPAACDITSLSTGLCRLLSVPAGRRTFPTLSLRIFPHVPGPLPRLLLLYLCPFLPTRHRPFTRYDRLGGRQDSVQRLSARAHFSRLQSYRCVQTQRFARHPGTPLPQFHSVHVGSLACLFSPRFQVSASLNLTLDTW